MVAIYITMRGRWILSYTFRYDNLRRTKHHLAGKASPESNYKETADKSKKRKKSVREEEESFKNVQVIKNKGYEYVPD